MHGPKLSLRNDAISSTHAKIRALGLDDASLSKDQINLLEILEKHRIAEFDVRDVEQTLATMGGEPYLLFLASLTGGKGQAAVRLFYSGMLAQLPADMEWVLISRTIGTSQIVVESILKFTHSVAVDWLIPGVAPTNQKLEIPIVLIFTFEQGALASERIYWDQASVLVQLGLLDRGTLPVVGAEAAHELTARTLGSDNGGSR